MTQRGPVLGLDFGERRIGVALSDPERLIASGLTTLDRRRQPDYLLAFEEIIRREKVTDIVVGYPLRTDGEHKPGGKTEAVDAFAANLRKRFGLPVHLEDESFTSALAADSLRQRGGKKRKPRDWMRAKADIDRVAACYILQDWLDRGETAP
jgi:putative Holliday junction resolvase